ncbi:unnamed protein product [Ceutorhynchus assimilis]|uniref:Coiled-coil domain-containing protein n=1 Tax=Ceutorhynchus assimilis TaxID=467358 RepID=A0A9N9MNZ7_9CUCU|nr:unnamed protein product [Ceutorhynchus assimilis]
MHRYSDNRNSVHGTAKRFVRRYVNPAIYIEEEIIEKPPRRIISRISECSDEELENNGSRRSSCTTIIVSKSNESPASSAYFSNEQSSSSSDNPKSASSTCKLDVQPNKVVMNELKLELGSLVTDATNALDTVGIISWTPGNNNSVQNWIEKKENNRKQKPNKIAQIMSKQREEKRKKCADQERENFKNWLARKNKVQEIKRMEKISEIEEEKLEAVRKEKKKIENVNNFNEWLKKKKLEEIEKKLTQNFTVLTSYQAKLKRIEESEQAYKEWLEHVKLRPKPVPMNQGLKSLSLLKSVTYINPIPWKPNMEFDNKRIPC